MSETVTVNIENLSTELKRIFEVASEKNRKMIFRKCQDAPRRFLREALAFYRSVLNVRSGRLRNSFEMVSRTEGDNYALGLRSDVEYALIQHEGGHTRPHVIEARNKRALFWPGAAHPVRRVNHPGSNIRPKKFFSTPISLESEKIFHEIKEEITL